MGYGARCNCKGKVVIMTTFELLKEHMENLPHGLAEIYYKTEAYKFICNEIDKLKEKS